MCPLQIPNFISHLFSKITLEVARARDFRTLPIQSCNQHLQTRIHTDKPTPMTSRRGKAKRLASLEVQMALSIDVELHTIQKLGRNGNSESTPFMDIIVRAQVSTVDDHLNGAPKSGLQTTRNY